MQSNQKLFLNTFLLLCTKIFLFPLLLNLLIWFQTFGIVEWGHTPISKLNIILDPSIKNHLFSISNETPSLVCPIAKHHKLSFPISTHKSKKIFELIHCDIWSPNSFEAYDGSKYFLTIIDDVSRSTWITILLPHLLLSCHFMIVFQFFLHPLVCLPIHLYPLHTPLPILCVSLNNLLHHHLYLLTLYFMHHLLLCYLLQLNLSFEDNKNKKGSSKSLRLPLPAIFIHLTNSIYGLTTSHIRYIISLICLHFLWSLITYLFFLFCHYLFTHWSTHFKEAVKNPDWCKAMETKLDALELNNTWVLTDLPPGKVPIDYKYVYKTKYHSNGTVERKKARLVAKGFTQQEEIDCHKTFSPVVKMATVRTLLALAAIQGWHLQ